MNRLILIGNGFDLAHGRKTSYSDFVTGYLRKALQYAETNGSYSDELLEIRFDTQIPQNNMIKNSSELLDLCIAGGGVHKLWQAKEKGIKHTTGDYLVAKFLTIKDKCKFFKNLIHICAHCNWVDIEKEYYDKLIETFKEAFSENEINSLHNSMRAIRRELGIYLNSLPKVEMMSEYDELFIKSFTGFDNQKFVQNTNTTLHYDRVIQPPRKIMILNFNYTDTLSCFENLKPKNDKCKLEVVNIHGSVASEENPMIFGFGDEVDSNYSLLENSNIKGVFEFTKSFWYFKTPNYHKLLNFIHAEPFQVYILGHSCGLTDRTMLKMIFEHDLCASIKIFYHNIEGNNNYTDLTYSIARHFSDKVKMRARVVPFDSCSPMPQRN